jgi:hypothetical protein
MRKIWRGIGGAIFWSYERGSWPYDLMVGVIVLFVMLTPRAWFHDQPQSGKPESADVHMLAEDSAARTRLYRLEAGALAPAKRIGKPTPELERETHDVLGRTVNDLKGQSFEVVRIEPVLASDGSVLAYDVTVHL